MLPPEGHNTVQHSRAVRIGRESMARTSFLSHQSASLELTHVLCLLAVELLANLSDHVRVSKVPVEGGCRLRHP